MLIKFIHAKFYASAIAIYNASKMNTHEFNKLLGFEAGANSPFHTPTGSATWYVIQFRARTAILAAESRTQRMWACPINVRSRCHQQISSRIKCFLSRAFILHFRTYHCLGSKETTTWTTYAYSYCSVLCRESCRPCRWAVRLRGGVGPGFHGKYFADTNLYDFILYSVSVIAVKCAISCYMGLRYNTTLVISFMNVMPVLWHVPVCVCVTCGVGGM